MIYVLKHMVVPLYHPKQCYFSIINVLLQYLFIFLSSFHFTFLIQDLEFYFLWCIFVIYFSFLFYLIQSYI